MKTSLTLTCLEDLWILGDVGDIITQLEEDLPVELGLIEGSNGGHHAMGLPAISATFLQTLQFRLPR